MKNLLKHTIALAAMLALGATIFPGMPAQDKARISQGADKDPQWEDITRLREIPATILITDIWREMDGNRAVRTKFISEDKKEYQLMLRHDGTVAWRPAK